MAAHTTQGALKNITAHEIAQPSAVSCHRWGGEGSSDDEENAQAVSVYARYKDGAAECEVTVLPLHARSIRLVPDQKAMKIGEQLLLNVEYTPADADVKDVEWSTSVAAVATVKDGVVVAKGYGTCEIIAKCGKAEARTYIIVL